MHMTQVREGDIVEVDTVLKGPNKSHLADKGSEDSTPDSDEETTVRRGRVVVKEIGEQTRKGGYHLTLIRYKHFALFQRRLFSSFIMQCPT